LECVFQIKNNQNKAATAHSYTVTHKQKKRDRMTNLLQECEMKSHRTNSTFGFLPTHKNPTLKNQKSNFISNAQKNTNNYKS